MLFSLPVSHLFKSPPMSFHQLGTRLLKIKRLLHVWSHTVVAWTFWSPFLQFHSIFQAGNTGKEEWNASSGPRENTTHQFYTAGNQSWAQRSTTRLERVTFLQGKARLEKEMADPGRWKEGKWKEKGRSSRDSSKHCINTNYPALKTHLYESLIHTIDRAEEVGNIPNTVNFKLEMKV